jgi:hypothetical protein
MNSLANCTVLTTEHPLAGTEAVFSPLRPSAAVSTFHPTFHFPGDTSGRHATPQDTLWLMSLNFPNGTGG